jgi:hypothetical protein
MNRKVFEKKRSWLNPGSILVFVWRYWGKLVTTVSEFMPHLLVANLILF